MAMLHLSTPRQDKADIHPELYTRHVCLALTAEVGDHYSEEYINLINRMQNPISFLDQ